MRTLACPHCGASIAPRPDAVRVQCEYCNATVEVTSEGVSRLAAHLQQAGVAVSPRPMGTEDIDREIAERTREENARRTTAIVWAGVFVLVCGGVLGALVLFSG